MKTYSKTFVFESLYLIRRTRKSCTAMWSQGCSPHGDPPMHSPCRIHNEACWESLQKMQFTLFNIPSENSGVNLHPENSGALVLSQKYNLMTSLFQNHVFNLQEKIWFCSNLMRAVLQGQIWWHSLLSWCVLILGKSFRWPPSSWCRLNSFPLHSYAGCLPFSENLVRVPPKPSQKRVWYPPWIPKLCACFSGVSILPSRISGACVF